MALLLIVDVIQDCYCYKFLFATAMLMVSHSTWIIFLYYENRCQSLKTGDTLTCIVGFKFLKTMLIYFCYLLAAHLF